MTRIALLCIILVSCVIATATAQDTSVIRRNISAFKDGQVISKDLTGPQDHKISDVEYDTDVIGIFNADNHQGIKSLSFVSEGVDEVLVSVNSKKIKPGDFVTSAGDGAVMKVTKKGFVLGQVLEVPKDGKVKVILRFEYLK